jgi:hypothetical protein
VCSSDLYITARPNAIDRRGNWQDSLNFKLPQSWTHGTVTLQIEAVGYNLEFSEPAEEGGLANDGIVEVTFEPTEQLEIKIIAVNWIDDSGAVHNINLDQLSELILRLRAIYPIASIDFSISSVIWPIGKPFFPFEINVLPVLAMMRIFDGCSSSNCCERLYFGAMLGCCGAFGAVGVAMGISGDVACAFIDSKEPNVHAHEIGHCLGRHHAVDINKNGACGERASQSAPLFPYFYEIDGNWRPTIGFMHLGEENFIYGLDTRSMNILDPKQNFELMSYCKPLWISDYTYEALQDSINDRFPSGGAGCGGGGGGGGAGYNYMLVQGSIDFIEDTVEFLPFGSLSSELPLTQVTSGDYFLELRDSYGNLIQSIPFQPDEYAGFGSETETGSFIIPVPVNPAIQEVRVLKGTIIKNSISASSTSPTVKVQYPNGGENLTGEKVILNWTANDNDGDTLVYTVQYSFDGKET